MSVRRLAAQQPESFAFSTESEHKVTFWMNKYPDEKKASAVIPLLWLAQKQEGWISEPAMRLIADRLEMPYIRVYEVATFYTMFNLAPVGEHHVQMCGTTPCWLRGSDDIKQVLKDEIGASGATSADGKLSWIEVECLGACANAPMVQISNKDGDFYYEDLTADSMRAILNDLRAGEPVEHGPVSSRRASEPTQATVDALIEASLYDGSAARPAPLPNTGDAPKPSAAPEPAAKPVPEPKAKANPAAKAKPAATEPERAGSAPALLDAPRDGKPDDLKKIGGVGPKIAALLNEAGVFHFDQIAGWGPDEIAWMDTKLKFKGRIERENWIAQAKTLAEETAT